MRSYSNDNLCLLPENGNKYMYVNFTEMSRRFDVMMYFRNLKPVFLKLECFQNLRSIRREENK